MSLVQCWRSINSLADVLPGVRLPPHPVPGGGWGSDSVQDQHTRTGGASRLWVLQHQRHKQGALTLLHVIHVLCFIYTATYIRQIPLALFKGDPAVRESEGSLLWAGHDQRGAADHHVPQPAILQVCCQSFFYSSMLMAYLVNEYIADPKNYVYNPCILI